MTALRGKNEPMFKHN